MIRAVVPALAAAVVLAAPSAKAAQLVSAPDAARLSETGEIILVDIRRPQEWRESGVAEPAATVSMHDEGFLEGLARLTGGRRDAPLAFICATGRRSSWVAQELEKRGYTNLINVREGMFGSSDGPGWLKRGLPVRKVER